MKTIKINKLALKKDIKRSFLKSKGRFFSILCLVALGSFALVGLQISGPDMRKTGETFFQQLKLADVSVIGDYGIDANDKKAIDKVSGAETISYGYLKDVVIKGTHTSIRVLSQTPGISEYELKSGRMPEKDDEIALASFLSKKYKLGETIQLTEKADSTGKTVLRHHDLKLVGFVDSAEFPSIINMGQSTAGTGELSGYGVVTPKAFDSDVYMIARLRFKDTRSVDPYSEHYTQLIQQHKDELKKLLAGQPEQRLQTIKNDYQEKIDDAQAQIDDGKKKLDDAKKKLDDGKKKLDDAKQQYADGQATYATKKADADHRLADGQRQLEDAARQIASGESQLKAKEKEIQNGETALKAARQTLDSKQAEYKAGAAKLDELYQAKSKLDEAQTRLDAAIKEAEAQTGKPLAQIQAELPAMKTRLAAGEAEYEGLSKLAALKAARDGAPAGSPERATLEKQYQDALRGAGLTEDMANAMLAKLGELKANYQGLEKLSQADAQYQAALKQAGLDEASARALFAQLPQMKAQLDGLEKLAALKAARDQAVAAGAPQATALKAQYQAALAQAGLTEEQAAAKIAALPAEKAKYQGLVQLSQADAQYQAALKQADLTEASARALFAQLPQMKAQIEGLDKLAALKAARDGAAPGTAQHEQAEAQYKAALRAAGLSEEAANAVYPQLPAQKAALDKAKAQIAKLDELFSSKQELDGKWAEYKTKAATAVGAEARLSQAKTKLDAGEKEYSAKKSQLENGKQRLATAKAQLASAKRKYASGSADYQAQKASADQRLAEARAELDQALATINENQTKLDDGWKKYYDEKPDADKKIADGEKKVSDAKDKIDRLKPPVYVLDTRRELPGSQGYRIYASVADIVDSLADIFPIFLYFVAALVTLTTMTRFVDEERINSGTLKALGYSNRDIVRKFTVYGLAASLSGAVIGIIAGHTLLPMIVYNAYGIHFTFPRIELHFYPKISLIALVLALMCAVLPAYIVAEKELHEKPAALLMPKPPEAGSKIFLERVKPIWNRLNFTRKVTARNIFRYKKRMLMTIFGVCGAVTLIFAGYSVKHSISGIKDRQFSEIMKYDLIVAQNNDLTQKEQQDIDKLLASDAIRTHMPIYYESVTKVAGRNGDKQKIEMIVPDNTSKVDNFIDLVDRRSGKKVPLTDDGCIISERLSNLLDVGPGQSFTITDDSGKQRQLTVSGITEMYMGHYIFMTKPYYSKIFGRSFSPNADLVTLIDRSIDNAQLQASHFMALDGVKGVVQNTTFTKEINTITQSLNRIMQILIIIAILLGMVILYNLTNINVSERIRELSTIKVLGFYNKEVTMYIYRETISLTLLGILAGFGFGQILHMYIITMVPPDNVMFDPALGWSAFLVPTVVVALITFILGLMMNYRLKHIDMLEALKSVE